MTKYKKKYHLLAEDQASYYFEALFLLFIQATFCICILTAEEFSFDKAFKYHYQYSLNLTLYFTSMILHFATIFTIRNGIIMTKYVIYHSEEFEHPKAAFLLGLGVVFVNMFCEITNFFNSLA